MKGASGVPYFGIHHHSHYWRTLTAPPLCARARARAGYSIFWLEVALFVLAFGAFFARRGWVQHANLRADFWACLIVGLVGAVAGTEVLLYAWQKEEGV